MPDNTDVEHFNTSELGRVLSSIADEDALKILVSAKKGIVKSTETIRDLGLTQRRYYVHLKELIKAGLIERVEDTYQLTCLGTVCYGLGQSFNIALNNRDQLDLADRLLKSKSISSDETMKIMSALSSKGVLGSFGIKDSIKPVRMIDNYESLITEIVAFIDKTEKDIYLASYSNDLRVMEAVLRAVKRNVRLSLLSYEDDQEGLSESLQMFRMLLTPRIVKGLYDLIGKEEFRIRQVEMPYGFCVLDEKNAIIEIPRPQVKTFYVGFSLESEALCQKLIKTFEELYDVGKEDPSMVLVRKLRTATSAR